MFDAVALPLRITVVMAASPKCGRTWRSADLHRLATSRSALSSGPPPTVIISSIIGDVTSTTLLVLSTRLPGAEP